jgi:hypothetical protein
MDEARKVLMRLDLIERLERESAPPDELLAHVRLLVGEAERWLRAEPAVSPAAEAAVAAARSAVGRTERGWRTLVA